MRILLILLVFILGVYTGGKVNQWKHKAEDASMIKRIEDGCLDVEVARRISEALDGTETIPRPRFHR